MTALLERDGESISRTKVIQACEILGYDATDVRSVTISGLGSVTVEAFLRIPAPGSERGLRVLTAPGEGYAYARVTHQIKGASTKEGDR